MYLTMDPFLIQKPATGTANRLRSNDILSCISLDTECMLLQIKVKTVFKSKKKKLI